MMMRVLHAQFVRAFLAIVAVSLVGTASTQAQQEQYKEVDVGVGAFSKSSQIPGWAEETSLPAADSKSPLAFRLIDTQFLAATTPSVYVHRALQVNEPGSLTAAGQISIGFVPQYQHLTLHKLVVHRGSESTDRMETLQPRFAQRDTGLERGIYSDLVTASILVSDLRVGDTIEYAYSIDGQNPVFAGKYFEGAGWDGPTPTVRRRVILNVPNGRDIKWRFVSESQQGAPRPTETTKGNLRQLEFNLENAGPTTTEQFSPADYIASRWIEFSEYGSWGEVGKWAYDIFKAESFDSAKFDELLTQIKSEPTDEKRLVSALEFVQREIRYFSIALGESSHRPTRPDVVLQRRYGDCKDKALLLVTLLEKLGIESHPVLLSLYRRRGLEKGLPSPSSFDHAIVQVRLKGKTYYLDPTRLGQHGTLDAMGQVHQGAQVLVIDAKTAELAEVPFAKAGGGDRIEINETASLSKFGGDGHLTVRQIWNGTYAEAMRVGYEQLSRDQFAKNFIESIEHRFPGAKLEGEVGFLDDSENNTVTVTMSFAVANMAIEQSGFWYIKLDPSNIKGVLAPHPTASRVVPLAIPYYPYNALYTLSMKLPANVSIWETPTSLDVHNKHFTASMLTRYRGNMVYTSIGIRTRADRVLPADFKDYSEAMRTVEKFPIGAIIVPSKLAKVATSKKSRGRSNPANDLAETIRQRIAHTTKAIRSGLIKGKDLAATFCARATARADLGEHDGAAADADKAVALAPDDPEIITCRSDVWFEAGKFKESIEEQSKALMLGYNPGSLLQARGISKFYAGKLDEAVEDFTRASEIQDLENQVYSDMWLTWTLLRLNKPLPGDLSQRAAMGANGAWPRPALAMLHGKVPPQNILAQLAQNTGIEALTNAMEAHFYLGQFYLVKGDKQKAHRHFAQALELNVVHYTEHTAAKFEIDALGDDAVAEGSAASLAKAKPAPGGGEPIQQPIGTAASAPQPQPEQAASKSPPTTTGSINTPPKTARKRRSRPVEDPDWARRYFP